MVVEFLGSALGGGVIALGLWAVLNHDCPVGTSTLTMKCVEFGEEVFTSPVGLMTFGGVIGLVVAGLVHLVGGSR